LGFEGQYWTLIVVALVVAFALLARRNLDRA
jgi:hypothetical protein